MSERTHSPAAPSRRSTWLSLATGTGVLLLGAAVWFQVFRASPAASQTEPAARNNAAAAPAGSLTGRVIARVNNQDITYDDIAAQCFQLHGKEILEAAISRTMIHQECQARGITISQAEMDKEIEETAKKFNVGADTWYKMLQTERGIAPAQYRADVIWPMLALRKLAGDSVKVTEEDMKIGFERDYGPRVKARMILIKGNLRQAGDIHAECLQKPNDFERIAMEKSADPNSKSLGGVIPPIQRHGPSKSLEDAAFRLQPGEISPVLQVPNQENAYIILKCEGRTEPVVADIKDVWEDLLANLKEEKMQNAVADVFEAIQKRSRVDNLLTGETRGASNPVRPVSGQAPARGNTGVVPAGR